MLEITVAKDTTLHTAGKYCQEDIFVKVEKSSGGTDTSDATATAADILNGKTAYVNGEKVTGSIATAAAPTPTVSVDSGGKITASVSNPKGYQSAATTKSATKQLTVQEAQTITPGTANQTIESGRYLTGAQTIQGDANLLPENIVSGKSIFGVAGSHTCSGGLDTSDATATENDIASGKTAYVNGEKIKGNVKIYTSGVVFSGASASFVGTTSGENIIELRRECAESRLFRDGVPLIVAASSSDFGDATAADVAEGKTFTSAAGLKVTGTAKAQSGGSSSGGLPSTIAAGDTPAAASFAGQQVTDTTATETPLTLTMKKAGTYRFRVMASASGSSMMGSSGSPTVALYKNGSAVSGASGTVSTSTVAALSFDVACAAGDVITVYGTAAGSTYSKVNCNCIALVACIDWDNGL